MNKYFEKIGVGLATVLCMGSLAFGVDVLSDVAAEIRDPTIVQDQDQAPDQDNRRGYVTRLFNVAEDGGSGVVQVGDPLPDNSVILGAWLQVITPVTPLTSTGSIGVVTAADLLANGTNLNAAAFRLLKPSGITSTFATNVAFQTSTAGTTNNAAFVTNGVVSSASATTLGTPIAIDTATNKVFTTFSGSTATAGVYMVILDVLKTQ